MGVDEERLIELLIALHDGFPRQGLGDAVSTRRALALCAATPFISCGAGIRGGIRKTP